MKKNILNLFQGHIEKNILVFGSKIPPKNNSTPFKPSGGSTMTHEDEEMQHEMSKLQEKVHLSQRATKNEMEVLKKGVEAKMNVLEAKMDGMEVGM